MFEPLFYMDVLTHDEKYLIPLTKNFWPLKNENLWLGQIPFKVFSTDYQEFVLSYLNEYFSQEKYLFDIETIDVDRGTEIVVEMVCKTAYLVSEYLKIGNFQDPLCAHYNPRLDKHVIHPGGTRQIVLDLFHQGDINTFYFNTRGHEFDFMRNLQKCNLEDLVETRKYNIALVPDHGSVIPHILTIKGADQNPPNMIKMHNFIKYRFCRKNFKVFCTRDIYLFDKWKTNDIRKADIVIDFKQKRIQNIRDILKVAYLALSGENYENDYLSVSHKT